MTNCVALLYDRTLVAVVFAMLIAGGHAIAQTPATLAPAATGVAARPPSVAPDRSSPDPSSEDIRDIRGAKPVASAWLLPLLLAGGIGIAAGAFAAWRWNKRRKPPSTPSPFEIALQRLENAQVLMHPNTGREFSIEVSNIIREYIEMRFQVMAAHRTTHEFLHDLAGSTDTLLSGHHTSLAGFLSLCDLAKFAGWNLSLRDMQTLQQSARSFVVETGGSKATGSSSVSRNPSAPNELDMPQAIPVTYHPSAGKEIHDSLPSA